MSAIEELRERLGRVESYHNFSRLTMSLGDLREIEESLRLMEEALKERVTVIDSIEQWLVYDLAGWIVGGGDTLLSALRAWKAGRG